MFLFFLHFAFKRETSKDGTIDGKAKSYLSILTAFTAGTVVQSFMNEDIAINTEIMQTLGATIPVGGEILGRGDARFAGLGLGLGSGRVGALAAARAGLGGRVLGSRLCGLVGWKSGLAGVAVLCRVGGRERNGLKELQGKQVVVGPRQMGGQNQHQVAARTHGGQGAHPGLAVRTRVAPIDESGVARTEGRVHVTHPGGKAHFHQGEAVGVGRLGLRDRQRRDAVQHQLLEVGLVQDNVVGALEIAEVGQPAELLADGHPGSQPNHPYVDLLPDQRLDRVVDIPRIGGEEGAKNDQDFSRAVAGRVQQKTPGHLQRILQAGIALGIHPFQLFQRLDVIVGVPADLTDGLCKPVPHDDNAELGYRVLVEEIADELYRIADHHRRPVRPEILFSHHQRIVQHQHHRPYNTSLERSHGLQIPLLLRFN